MNDKVTLRMNALVAYRIKALLSAERRVSASRDNSWCHDLTPRSHAPRPPSLGVNGEPGLTRAPIPR
jgi:hypothetical protein